MLEANDCVQADLRECGVNENDALAALPLLKLLAVVEARQDFEGDLSSRLPKRGD